MPNTITFPAGWIDTRIGDAFEVELGKMLDEKTNSGNNLKAYLTNRNVQWNRIEVDSVGLMNFSADEQRRFRLKRGDLLICEGGEVGRAAIWNDELDECYYQKALHRLRPKRPERIDPRFLLHYFEYSAKRGLLAKHVGRTSIGHLPREKLIKLSVTHPISLLEQRRIVGILDAVDRQCEDVCRELAKVSTLRDSTAKALISVSAQDRVDKVWRQVKELGEVQIGRQLSPIQKYGPHMRPYLRVANVYGGYIDYSDVLEMNFTPAEYEVFSLKPGDILLNEGQSIDLVGRSAIFNGPSGMGFQNTLLRFRSRECVLPEFAQAVFSEWLRSGEFAKIARQTTSIAHLGADRFASMWLPVPPLEEQRRIADALGLIDTYALVLKEKLSKLILCKEGLAEDLLTGQVQVH